MIRNHIIKKYKLIPPPIILYKIVHNIHIFMLKYNINLKSKDGKECKKLTYLADYLGKTPIGSSNRQQNMLYLIKRFARAQLSLLGLGRFLCC